MTDKFGDVTHCGWARRVAPLLFGIALLVPGVAAAQSPQIPPPEPYSPTDANGINLFSGSYTYTSPTISIGTADGGLSYTASFDTSANEWRHSVWGGVAREPFLPPSSSTPAYTVTVMGQTAVFANDGHGGYLAIEGDGTLTRTGGAFTYTTLDGTVAVFDGGTTYSPYIANEGLIRTLTRPNGERLTFTYVNPSTSVRILRSVTSSRGYQLHFQYTSDTSFQLVKVTALNNAVDACAPTANVCTFSRTWPSLTFTQTGSGTITQRTVTDANGDTTTLLFPGGWLSGVRRPTLATGQNITLTRDVNQKYATFADGFGPWTYDYTAPPPVTPPPYEQFYTTTVRDPLGKNTVVQMSSVQSLDLPAYPAYRTTRVTSATNALGQATTYSYTTIWNLHRVTYPEGNWEQYGYTERGDLISATRSPKPGSGLTATTVSATLTPGCPANPVLCGRPATITDARGNVTSYTYDPTHGGLLTATSPAPTSGAVRPQTRTAYAQRYAWYKANGAAAITQAALPIWVPVGTSACTTSAGCDGLTQEVQTSIVHQTGSAGVGANILPVSITSGSGDGLLAATTTTVWDANGDPLTVNGPLAGAADTTRYVYDAMRQPVGQIGPDPDGAGPRLHPATRTTYDGDGQPIFVERGTTTGQTDPAWAAFTSLQAVQTYYATKGLISRQVAFPGADAQTITDYSYNGRRQPLCTTVRMNPAATPPLYACTLSTEGSYGPDRVTLNSYDNAGRLIKVESAVGTPLQQATLTQAWTPNGQVDWVEDANGNRSNFTYDGLDRLAQLNFPMPTLGAHAANPADYEQYGYDANDNPLTKRTRAGETFTTAFDALNRITAIDAPSPTNDVAFTYDLLGRRLTASHPGGQTLTSTWDALGRNTAETGPLGAMTYQYDLAGRRTRMTWPDSVYVAYGWDLSNAMTEIRLNGAGLITGYAYDDLGRRTGITRGVGGAATAYAYDGGGRLLSLTQPPPPNDQDARKKCS